uniref:caprin-1-like isoform X1 n=1 Tax=Styela clava TaxID=7725 RepID=UPI00193990A7|nr:caprin-1-like isoform X1 [Styela clava]
MVQKGSGGVVLKPQQASMNQSMNYEAISQDPLKHVITFIEKKIRNLDKRKAKLDGYRRMVEDGKPLDPDQTAAASKYDEVIGSLEFAKDLIKNFEATTIEVMKQQRKTTRREQTAREEADHNRVCFVVRSSRIMELLYENELIREDFLNGSNGACVVSKLELDQLVNFYDLFIMKSYEAGTNITEDANSAGNHMYELAEGRMKDIVGTSYKELHALLDRINDCKYFEDLRDINPVPETHHTPAKNEVASVSSDSSAEEELSEKQEEEKDYEEERNEDEEVETAETHALSPNTSDSISSSGFADAPLKTEEFLASSRSVTYTAHTNDTTSWQQQPSKPEQAGDYLPQSVNFQYTSTVPSQMKIQNQSSSYQAQRIQEVLAEVQGPCQFLQESIIEREMGANPAILSFTGMEMHQQTMPATTVSPTSRTHQMPRTSALESVFQQGQTQSISPIDQNMMQSQGLPGTQQHLQTKQKDNQSPLNNTVSHQEHLNTVSETRQSGPQEPDFRSSPNTYMPPATSTQPPSTVGYTMGRQPPDNLGLGQTTFGSQQQSSEQQMSFISQTTNESEAFQQDDKVPSDAYKSNAGYPQSHTQQPAVIQNLMQQHSLSTPSLQAPDPPSTHIPLPNEQQSGYRSYQANDNVQADIKPIEPTSQNQRSSPSVMQQDQTISKDSQDPAVSSSTGDSPRESKVGNQQQPGDQNQGYQSRGGQQNANAGRTDRGNYGRGNQNYKSGPVNQGGGNGGYHQQRGNYRGGNRYNNGNFDSIGRPNNYQGGYQNNQSGGYVPRQYQPDQYGYRRGSGGGMRGGRGHQGRGNPRAGGGGGNYNRSRTFRPHQSGEQAT